MSWLNLLQKRQFFFTFLPAPVAAPGKSTALLHFKRTWRLSLCSCNFLILIAIYIKNRTKQHFRIWMYCFCSKRLTLQNFHNSSQIHNCDSLTYTPYQCQVMPNKQTADLLFFHQLYQQLRNLVLYGNIQCTCRFITDQ